MIAGIGTANPPVAKDERRSSLSQAALSGTCRNLVGERAASVSSADIAVWIRAPCFSGVGHTRHSLVRPLAGRRECFEDPMHKPLAIAFAVLAASIAGVSAQTYPDRSIKVVVPYPAGGPTDTVARTVTQGLAADLGQSVIIENQAGAGGRVALKAIARAAPDGYTLLLGGTNNNAITPALYKDLDFDPVKDFAPVAALASDSLVLVVHPSVPATTLAELVRYAKDNPGKLSSGGG